MGRLATKGELRNCSNLKMSSKTTFDQSLARITGTNCPISWPCYQPSLNKVLQMTWHHSKTSIQSTRKLNMTARAQACKSASQGTLISTSSDCEEWRMGGKNIVLLHIDVVYQNLTFNHQFRRLSPNEIQPKKRYNVKHQLLSTLPPAWILLTLQGCLPGSAQGFKVSKSGQRRGWGVR